MANVFRKYIQLSMSIKCIIAVLLYLGIISVLTVTAQKAKVINFFYCLPKHKNLVQQIERRVRVECGQKKNLDVRRQSVDALNVQISDMVINLNMDGQKMRGFFRDSPETFYWLKREGVDFYIVKCREPDPDRRRRTESYYGVFAKDGYQEYLTKIKEEYCINIPVLFDCYIQDGIYMVIYFTQPKTQQARHTDRSVIRSRRMHQRGEDDAGHTHGNGHTDGQKRRDESGKE